VGSKKESCGHGGQKTEEKDGGVIYIARERIKANKRKGTEILITGTKDQNLVLKTTMLARKKKRKKEKR